MFSTASHQALLRGWQGSAAGLCISAHVTCHYCCLGVYSRAPKMVEPTRTLVLPISTCMRFVVYFLSKVLLLLLEHRPNYYYRLLVVAGHAHAELQVA